MVKPVSDNVFCGTEELVYSGRISVPYTWSVGETGSRFFIEIRDNKRIFGTHCPECNYTFVPPRKVCPRCFEKGMEWKELGDEGILLTYTIPHYHEDVHPIKDPFAFGIIKLDGADTGFTHLLGEFQPGELRKDLRVRAVFRDERKGNILDIKYFKPIR